MGSLRDNVSEVSMANSKRGICIEDQEEMEDKNEPKQERQVRV